MIFEDLNMLPVVAEDLTLLEDYTTSGCREFTEPTAFKSLHLQ